MTRLFSHILIALTMPICVWAQAKQPEQDIIQYISKIDATIGVGAIVNENDTISINSRSPMPMMSVYKFPIAMAVGEKCCKDFWTLDSTLLISHKDLKLDTYSPMLEKYLLAKNESVRISLRELLEYSLQQSDNNASDILLEFAGGADKVQAYLDSIGFGDIKVVWSEDEMHQEPLRSYDNCASALDIAKLLDKFNRDSTHTLHSQIKTVMENCTTGTDRIPAPLKYADATIGHKTGTGFMLDDGRIMAVNDVAYINLPNGGRYSLAVFIKDARLSIDNCSATIARISEIIYKYAMSSYKTSCNTIAKEYFFG